MNMIDEKRNNNLTLGIVDDNYSLREDSAYNLFLWIFLLGDFKNKILFQADKWL